MRVRTDYENWNDLWEEVENVIPVEETTETQTEDKIHQPLSLEEEFSIRTRYNYW